MRQDISAQVAIARLTSYNEKYARMDARLKALAAGMFLMFILVCLWIAWEFLVVPMTILNRY